MMKHNELAKKCTSHRDLGAEGGGCSSYRDGHLGLRRPSKPAPFPLPGVPFYLTTDGSILYETTISVIIGRVLFNSNIGATTYLLLTFQSECRIAVGRFGILNSSAWGRFRRIYWISLWRHSNR